MSLQKKISSLDEIKVAVRKVLKEYWEKENSVEVIITYDCIESDFRNNLREQLLKTKYKAITLSESTYKLTGKFSPTQIDILANEIISLYDQVINESKKAIPNSIVGIIIPVGKEFKIFDINLKV